VTSENKRAFLRNTINLKKKNLIIELDKLEILDNNTYLYIKKENIRREVNAINKVSD